MQNPTDQAEAAVPSETVVAINSTNLNRTFTVRRKAAKRSERWYQHTAEPLSTPARKKPRHGEHVPTTKDNASRETASPEMLVAFLPPTTDTDDENSDLVIDTQQNACAAATGRWALEEDAKLTSAVAKTKKKRWGQEYKIDWVAVASFVPGRTNEQCHQRWKFTLDPSIDRSAPGRTGKWTEDEDLKLKYSVEMHGGKDWAAIAVLVLDRTRKQCSNRWKDVLDPSIERTNGRTGKWTKDEDLKLQGAVQMHGGKSWVKIATLIPGRTRVQCCRRWFHVLDPSINRTNGRTGSWTEKEDLKLKTSVEMHGGKDWAAIAVLVPERTNKQCWQRWYDVLDPSIDRSASGRTGKWTEDEDLKLQGAVQVHGTKSWMVVAELVPDRTKKQCWQRWRALDPSIALTPGRTGTWTENEDIKLQHSVQMHEGKDWVAIATLVPGRTKMQCYSRWSTVLAASINKTNGPSGKTGKWTEDEDFKLTTSVQMHGGKDWAAIAVMVPGRTKNQCYRRWEKSLNRSIDRHAAGRTFYRWTEDEDLILKNAVVTHGGKNWALISALVPGRTKGQCSERWYRSKEFGMQYRSSS
jgi:hypothetical protein